MYYLIVIEVVPHHPPTLNAGGRWKVPSLPGVISTRRWAPCLLQEFPANSLNLLWRLWSPNPSPGVTLVPRHRPPPLLVRGRSAL